MSVTFKWSEIGRQEQSISFFTDVVMIILIMLNLSFIVFDWHFDQAFFRNFLKQVVPDFYHFYNDKVHPNFLLYDMIFVSIFITEFLIRWLIAVVQKTFHRWFYFPFVYWYDILGCIPLGSFRWLRILRLVSMTIRLHKMKVINIRETYLFKKAMKYYSIVMEEVSDRVVLNVLDGVQKEIESNTPITDKMITEVIRPHKHTLIQWLSHRVRTVTEQNYELYREDIKKYVEEVIKEAVNNNQEVKNIKMIPVVGSQITKALEQSVSGVTFNVINGMVQDLSSDSNSKLIEEIADIIFETFLFEEEDQNLDNITKDIFIRALGLVKEQVAIKQWQLEEAG